MDPSFFDSYWNMPSQTWHSPFVRSVPSHHPSPSPSGSRQESKPSQKVVQIPVHSVSSVKGRDESAKTIQKVFRGFLVRKSVKRIGEIRREVDETEKLISEEETMELIRRDSKYRLRVNETLMSLLFKLDSVKGVDSGVRDCRKAVIKKVIAMEEFVDRIVSDNQDSRDGQNVNLRGNYAVNSVDRGVDELNMEDKIVSEHSEGGKAPGDENLELQGTGPDNAENCNTLENTESVRACEQSVQVPCENQAKIESMEFDGINKGETQKVGDLAENNNEGETQKVGDLAGNNNEGETQKVGDLAENNNEGETQKVGDLAGNNNEGETQKVGDLAENNNDKQNSENGGRELPHTGECLEDCTGTIQTESQSWSSDNSQNSVEESDDGSKKGGENEDNDGVKKENRGTRELFETLIEDNEKMMTLMAELYEKSAMQTSLLESLSQRVEQLERAFRCDKLRRKKRSAVGAGAWSKKPPNAKKEGNKG